MGVIPRNPWMYTAHQDTQCDVPTGQRDDEKEIDGGYSNETPVIAVIKVGIQILELFSPPQEGTGCESWV